MANVLMPVMVVPDCGLKRQSLAHFVDKQEKHRGSRQRGDRIHALLVLDRLDELFGDAVVGFALRHRGVAQEIHLAHLFRFFIHEFVKRRGLPLHLLVVSYVLIIERKLIVFFLIPLPMSIGAELPAPGPALQERELLSAIETPHVP